MVNVWLTEPSRVLPDLSWHYNNSITTSEYQQTADPSSSDNSAFDSDRARLLDSEDYDPGSLLDAAPAAPSSNLRKNKKTLFDDVQI